MKFRYETLEIWQLAMKLWELWQQIRTKYPKHEQYKLVDQLDRAIEGIGSVIVEGSAKSSARDFSRYRENIFQGSWFSKMATSSIPRWAGYTLGYQLVSRYRKAHPDQTAASLVSTPAEMFVAGG